MDYALLAAFVLAFFFDNVVIAYWSYHKATRRARDLIIGDPMFNETREALRTVKTDLLAVRHDMESLSARVTTANADTARDLRKDLGSLTEWTKRHETLGVNAQIPPSVTEELRASLKSSLRSFMRTDAAEVLAETVSEAVKAAVDERLGPTRPEDVAEALDAQAAAGGLYGLLASEAESRGIDRSWVDLAFDKGPDVLRALAARWGIAVPEVHLLGR